MPIFLAPLDQEFTIFKVTVDEKLKKHLESLGIMTNAKIRVLSNHRGSVICMVKEGRLALDKNIALKIFVA